MTAPATDRPLPSFSNADFDTARTVIFREIAQHDVDGTLPRAEAFRRIIDRTPHMPGHARLNAYDQLVAALTRLDYVRSDMWDPAEGDRDTADLAADDDAQDAVRKLVAGAR